MVLAIFIFSSIAFGSPDCIRPELPKASQDLIQLFETLSLDGNTCKNALKVSVEDLCLEDGAYLETKIELSYSAGSPFDPGFETLRLRADAAFFNFTISPTDTSTELTFSRRYQASDPLAFLDPHLASGRISVDKSGRLKHWYLRRLYGGPHGDAEVFSCTK